MEMPKRRKPGDRDLGLILTILRVYRDLHQSEAAAAAGLPASAVSEYEGGKRAPHLKNLERLVAGLGFELSVIDEGRRFLDRLRAAEVLPSAKERAEAPALFARLERHPAPVRRALIKEVADFRSWALAEFIAHRSSSAAADSAGKTLELAELAVAVAEQVPGGESWRARLRGYCLAHLANARRVAGNFRACEEAFQAAERLWNRGADPLQLLSEARLLAMKASLRREQRRPAESLDLLEQALVAPGGQELSSTLLVNKATTLEIMGDLEGAIALLRQIAPRLEAEGDPRLIFCLRQNLLDFLSKAGRAKEAALLLPEAKRLAQGELDRLRVRWAEARIAASLGERARAVRLLSEVRAEFATREIHYDSALATLELAMCHLEDGRFAEVRSLARHMVPIFQASEIHRETLAALTVFRKAAEEERVTVEVVRRLTGFVYRARHIAGLRFDVP